MSVFHLFSFTCSSSGPSSRPSRPSLLPSFVRCLFPPPVLPSLLNSGVMTASCQQHTGSPDHWADPTAALMRSLTERLSLGSARSELFKVAVVLFYLFISFLFFGRGCVWCVFLCMFFHVCVPDPYLAHLFFSGCFKSPQKKHIWLFSPWCLLGTLRQIII